MADNSTSTQDPRTKEAQPPFPAQEQQYPGLEKEMRPAPDYGEASYKGSGKLLGKAAIITGGDSGIGRAVALAFAREGADVLISYLSEESDAQETARVVREAGRKAVMMAGDIGQEAHCRNIVDRAVQEFGKVDLLINNAAYQQTFNSIEEIPAEEWDKTYHTNLFSMFYLCKAAIPHMQPGSAIVNTSSIQGYQPSSSLLVYASTKAAIVDFTKALSSELVKKGIRVNSVAPGPIWTPLIVSTMGGDQSISEFGKETPMGRAGQPAELAPAYVFLASNDSSYITGEVIGVTGGSPIS
jgi:NAD(P)-dependent dehydrogenase (short-subunit alcohol dehydrogenase family)